MSSGAVRIAGRRLHALRWRTLSTSTGESSPLINDDTPLQMSTDDESRAGSDATKAPEDRERARAPRGSRVQSTAFHPRMIFVRPWDGLPTMAHAFAIIRDIERRFGKIQEFAIIRDTDVLSKYAPWLHAIFVREEDAAAIPIDGRVIQVVAPQLKASEVREGGIGLADLSVYLDPETREQALSDREARQKGEKEEEREEWGPPAEGQVMDVKLERTIHHQMPSGIHKSFGLNRRGPPHVQNPFRTQELAHAITAFGGFVDPPPEGSSQGETSMQRLTRQWGRMIYPPRDKSAKTTRTEAPRREVVAENGDDGVSHSGALDGPVIPWKGFGTDSAASASVALQSSGTGMHQDLADAPAPAPNEALPNTSPVAHPPSSATHRDLFTPPVLDKLSSGTPLPGAPSSSPSVQSKPAEPTSKPSSQSNPTLSEAHLKPPQSKPKPVTNTTPPPPPPSPSPAEPKISKKKRLLNAARLAGTLAAENQSQAPSPPPAPGADTRPVEDRVDMRSEMNPGASTSDDRPADVDAAGRDSKASENENKAAARKWWNFFGGGN